MVIREATAADIEAITSLMRLLIAEHHKNDPDYRSVSEFRGLPIHIRKIIADSDSLVLVAENGQTIVGYFIANIEEAPTYIRERRIGIIADTCVNPKFRKQGVMTSLFDVALQWFRKNDVRRIELSVHLKNKSAITAWEKLGFKTYRLRMQRSVL